MSFTVTLYQFSKKENSTARPSGTGTAYPCVVRTDTGIVNPTIELNLGLTNSPANYNYAYIAEFGRYYFIDEWIFSNRLWLARMSVDVLATFKPQVGAASLYILRASADYDGSIIDNKYPTKTGSTYQAVFKDNPWSTQTINGTYIIGFVCKYPSAGSVRYIACDVDAMMSILQGLMNDVVTTGNEFGNFDELSQQLQLNLIDPIQYIKSCVYIPLPISRFQGSQLSSPINIYNYDIPFTGVIKNVPGTSFTTEVNFVFDLPKHPQTAARGNFVNCAPYTDLQLSVPPFGVIQLDTTITCNWETVAITIRIDIPTGKGVLQVFCNGKLVTKQETQLGVSVVLSQVTRDYFGAAMSAATGTANVIGSALTGNIGGAIGSGISAIGNAYQSMIPKSNSIGAGGSYAQFYERPRLDAQFFEVVDDDINHNGRPLCQMRTPASLGGYMLVQDGDIPIPGTAQEARQVRAYLEGGFYYE